MKSGVLALALVALAVAACQPDQPRRQPRGEGGSSGSGREGPPPAEGVQPIPYQLFDREDVDGPPRATLHLLLARDAGRGELRATLSRAITDLVSSDSSLVALRSVGYVARGAGTGEREALLLPVAWAEWLPPSGWYDATEEARHDAHRIYFYHGSPPPWQQ